MTSILGLEYTVPVLRQGTLTELILNSEELQSKLGDCGAEGQVYKPKTIISSVQMTTVTSTILLSNTNMTLG